MVGMGNPTDPPLTAYQCSYNIALFDIEICGKSQNIEQNNTSPSNTSCFRLIG